MPYRSYMVSIPRQGEDRASVVLTETPLLWMALETVADRFCAWVLRHRACHLVAGPAMEAAEKRTRKYTIPISLTQAREIYVWLGLDTKEFDDEERSVDEED